MQPMTTAMRKEAITLLRSLKISSRNCDYVLVGDGSGSRYGMGVGSACIIIRTHANPAEPWLYEFAWSAGWDGTNSIAELLAYLLPLNRIDYWETKLFEETKIPRSPAVHVVTDSEYVVNAFSPQASSTWANWIIVAALKAARHRGLRVTAHHIDRETHVFNAMCDRLAGEARKSLLADPLEFLSSTDLTGTVSRLFQEPENGPAHDDAG